MQKLVDLLHIWSILIEKLALRCRLQVSLARPPQWPSRSRCLCCQWARGKSWCRASPRGSVQTFWWTWRMFCLGRTWTETACSPGYRPTLPSPDVTGEFWRVYSLKSGTEEHYWENTLRLRDGYLTLLAPRGMKKQTLTLTDGGKLSLLSFNDGASAFLETFFLVTGLRWSCPWLWLIWNNIVSKPFKKTQFCSKELHSEDI